MLVGSAGSVEAVPRVKFGFVVVAVVCALVGPCPSGWAAPGPPSAPRSVTPVPGNAAATVSWVAPFSDGGHAVTEYEVLTYHHDVRLAINVFRSSQLTQRIEGLKNGSV